MICCWKSFPYFSIPQLPCLLYSLIILTNLLFFFTIFLKHSGIHLKSGTVEYIS